MDVFFFLGSTSFIAISMNSVIRGFDLNRRVTNEAILPVSRKGLFSCVFFPLILSLCL